MTKLQVELQGSFGSDRDIAEAAWTSSSSLQGKAKRSDLDVERIVTQLARDGHGVPFESVILRFWMRLPIMIDRQVITHRLSSQNGMSSRYRTMPDDFYGVPKDVVNILEKCMPMYGKLVDQHYHSLALANNEFYRNVLKQSKEAENNQLITNTEYKRVREIIRGILPQSNMTERVTTINLRSFANFQKLRNSEHAQQEIRLIAEMMLQLVKDNNIAPVAIRELEKKGWVI